MYLKNDNGLKLIEYIIKNDPNPNESLIASNKEKYPFEIYIYLINDKKPLIFRFNSKEKRDNIINNLYSNTTIVTKDDTITTIN